MSRQAYDVRVDIVHSWWTDGNTRRLQYRNVTGPLRHVYDIPELLGLTSLLTNWSKNSLKKGWN